MSCASEPTSLYWFDYETFGTQPEWDRPCQFAGIRTNLDLEEIDDPLVIYCQQSMDYLPHPLACRVTGLWPQRVNELGVPEPEFIRRIVEQTGAPGTCSVGYNSIAFDDEFTRHTLFRNFYDAYEHEYKNGSSRWDLLDVVRLTRALRPAGIQWPVSDKGSPSNRLELLSSANNIEHGDAHDALSDVRATIGLARLIRKAQPKLYQYLFDNRTKQAVSRLLNTKERRICLLVSRTLPAARSHITAILPLMLHPTNRNGVVVLDLHQDPDGLLQQDQKALRARLRTVPINKCPAVVPFNVLMPDDASRLKMDIEAIRQHAEHASCLLTQEGLVAIEEALSIEWPERHPDPEGSLYSGGFMSAEDRERCNRLRECEPELIMHEAAHFEDRRFSEMAFRYQARHFYNTLDAESRAQWAYYCHARLNDDTAPWLSFATFRKACADTRWADSEAALKAALESYAATLETHALQGGSTASVGSATAAVHEVSAADDGPHGIHDKE